MEIQPSILPINGARCSALGCSICTGLSPDIKSELSRMARARTFRAGETVLAEADPIGFVGHVVSGVLRMQKTLADGRQQIVGLLLPSDMFGRVFAETSPVAVEAATDATLCCFERNGFEALLARHPEVEHRVLMSVAQKLDAAQDWMMLLATQTVLGRVANFMLFLRASETPLVSIVSIPIARRDMAAYLGTTVESLSRSIQLLARRRIIRILDAHRFEIVDLHRLKAIAGSEPEDDARHEPELRRAG